MKKPLLLWICLALTLAGCAALQPRFERPTVHVTDFRLLPSQGLAPRFAIGLHVVNPNPRALEVRGITYSVILDGHRILTAVANDLPTIDAYGEGDVTLQATASLLNSARVIAGFLQTRRDSVAYQLNLRLDLNNWLPDMNLEEVGTLALTTPHPEPQRPTGVADQPRLKPAPID